MTGAKLISGTQVAKWVKINPFECDYLKKNNFFLNKFSKHFSEIRQSLKQQVLEWKNNLPSFAPGLRIVQVGGREDSNVYIRMKIKAANEIGIAVEHVQLPRSITELELLEKVRLVLNCTAYNERK